MSEIEAGGLLDLGEVDVIEVDVEVGEVDVEVGKVDVEVGEVEVDVEVVNVEVGGALLKMPSFLSQKTNYSSLLK